MKLQKTNLYVYFLESMARNLEEKVILLIFLSLPQEKCSKLINKTNASSRRMLLGLWNCILYGVRRRTEVIGRDGQRILPLVHD